MENTSEPSDTEEIETWKQKLWNEIMKEARHGAEKTVQKIVYKHLTPLLNNPDVPEDAKQKAKAFAVLAATYHNRELVPALFNRPGKNGTDSKQRGLSLADVSPVAVLGAGVAAVGGAVAATRYAAEKQGLKNKFHPDYLIKCDRTGRNKFGIATASDACTILMLKRTGKEMTYKRLNRNTEDGSFTLDKRAVFKSQDGKNWVDEFDTPIQRQEMWYKTLGYSQPTKDQRDLLIPRNKSQVDAVAAAFVDLC